MTNVKVTDFFYAPEETSGGILKLHCPSVRPSVTNRLSVLAHKLLKRWCWVNFQCRGVLLIWIRVGQGPTALALGAGGGCLDIFSLVYHFSFLPPSLWETARYRLKYCLKGRKAQNNQPTTEANLMKLHRKIKKNE